MAKERIWRRKRSRLSLWIMFIQNVKVVGNSRLVTIVAIIVSIALLITVVLVGKYLMMTRYINKKDLESDRTQCCFSRLQKLKCNNQFSAKTRNYFVAVVFLDQFLVSVISVHLRKGVRTTETENRVLGKEDWLGYTRLGQHCGGMFDEFSLVE